MEVGHMTIDLNGKDARGSRGCWERYASGPAMVNLHKPTLKNKRIIPQSRQDEELTPRLIYEEAMKKDEAAVAIMEEYSTYVGIGIVKSSTSLIPRAYFSGRRCIAGFSYFFTGSQTNHKRTGMPRLQRHRSNYTPSKSRIKYRPSRRKNRHQFHKRLNQMFRPPVPALG